MTTDRVNELRETIEGTLANARRVLLDSRTPAGHWEGELSSSALSTATAVFALSLYARHRAGDADRYARLIANGVGWLLEHQNDDGGWGDTTLSFSNISTTALCWAALSVTGGEAKEAVSAAEGWLTRAAGSLEPKALARAIAARYGKDRTFSVPILTMCALAGRLGGDDAEAWRLIPQLPFELAALPQAWFRFVRLPVVSYALPALIAMGLARHRKRPSRNPVTRTLRGVATKRVLRVLTGIQPQGGGFLEATPLTSFVVMSLIGGGRHDHPVVAAGVDFLVRSARADGSWPIDTNLATWVTTLSVNALATGGGPGAVADALPAPERRAVREWLLGQQYHAVHPYTGAPPGAWAWTNLPGGVPDADDTAGALVALHNLGDVDERVTRAAGEAVRWLLDLQNGDGGIPTFCRGWTNLPFDRSGADLTAHALHAWWAWRDRLPAALAARVDRAADRALDYLSRHQRSDGAWVPLWFGNQAAADEENPTYGTAKVLVALSEQAREPRVADMVTRGAAWLVAAQNADGGWGGAPGTPSSVEETGLALDALAAARNGLGQDAGGRSLEPACEAGGRWLVENTGGGRRFPVSPIGFYFAKLWYFERAYPVLLTVGGLGRAAGVVGSSEGAPTGV